MFFYLDNKIFNPNPKIFKNNKTNFNNALRK